MRRIFLFITCLAAMDAFTQPHAIGHQSSVNRFNQGEELSFELGYGWFALGKAQLVVADELHQYEQAECYKVDISGRTTGILGAFSKVDDTWGGFVDVNSMLPLHAYADLNEGKYQRKEDIIYDHEEGLITVDMIKKHRQRPIIKHEFEGELYDLISGYLKVRNIDFGVLEKGDTVRFPAFYDGIFYDFGLLYDGQEKVKSEVGKLTAHRVIPIIPENKIFPGTNPIIAWISADANQLPLKVEADMFFGHAYVELTGYKNIKYGPDFKQ